MPDLTRVNWGEYAPLLFIIAAVCVGLAAAFVLLVVVLWALFGGKASGGVMNWFAKKFIHAQANRFEHWAGVLVGQTSAVTPVRRLLSWVESGLRIVQEANVPRVVLDPNPPAPAVAIPVPAMPAALVTVPQPPPTTPVPVPVKPAPASPLILPSAGA